MNFAKHVKKLVVGENGLQESFENDVHESTVESLMLEHAEDEHHSLPRRLGTDQVLQFIFNLIRRSIRCRLVIQKISCNI